jgi:non-specific serine/threonine protein kinase
MITTGVAPSFIGRSQELDQLQWLVASNRLVTVMGAPGAGKTRLAFEAAARVADQFPGGVYVCELAPIAAPPLVRTALATSLGFPPEAPGDLGTLIHDRFGSKPTLIVVDNCEHVKAEVAQTILSMLSAPSGLRILATSRERLRVATETAWALPSLSPEEALRLLVMRVAAVDASFELNAGNRSALLEICDRLERLPLALELVAARLALLPALEVAQMLNQALNLLTGGEGRHRTMTAALDWSVALLPPTSAQDLWRLSVFPSPFALEAAAIVLEASRPEALDRLGRLRDASLLVSERSGVSARFRLLEPIRQYAAARLEHETSKHEVRRLHALYVVTRAKWIGARLLGTDEQAAALAAFGDLLPDLRIAFAWCHDAQLNWAGEIMGHTGWAWEITGRVREGEALERRALEVTTDPADRARLFVRLAGLTQRRDDYEAGNVANQGIVEARNGDNRQELAFALCFAGCYDLSDSGEEKFDEAAAIGGETRDRLIPAFVSTFRGIRRGNAGDMKVARMHHEDAVARCTALGDAWLIAQTTSNLVDACQDLDDVGAVRKHLRTVLRILVEHADWIAAFYALMFTANLAVRTGRAADALRILSLCRRLREEIGLPFRNLEEVEQTARAALGGRSRQAKHAIDGDRLDLVDGLRLALDIVEKPSRFVSARTGRRDPITGLTQREHQVVRLVAAGLTNRAIATKLFMTERSAEGHVERIRNKLDVHSRGEIALWAEEHGLAPSEAIEQN